MSTVDGAPTPTPTSDEPEPAGAVEAPPQVDVAAAIEAVVASLAPHVAPFVRMVIEAAQQVPAVATAERDADTVVSRLVGDFEGFVRSHL